VKGLRSSRNHCAALVAKVALAGLVTLSAIASFAQGGAMSPYQGEQDGVSAGGKWMMFQGEDKMTGAKRVRFELLAENYFREDPNYKPRVELVCENGKLEVEVRVDDVHYFKGWNWEGRGRFLQMDKGTARGLMAAHVLNIALPTRSGRQIAEFQPDGLDLGQVRTACDLTPKKPSKD